MFFFFKQKTAYELRISDWSSDVCSSDLEHVDRNRSIFIDADLIVPRHRRRVDRLAKGNRVDGDRAGESALPNQVERQQHAIAGVRARQRYRDQNLARK